MIGGARGQAPRDKIVCILNCCRVINNLLHVAAQAGEARGERPLLWSSFKPFVIHLQFSQPMALLFTLVVLSGGGEV